MAANIYLKSAITLVSFGGLGYFLMNVFQPSEQTLKEIKSIAPKSNLIETEKKTLLFTERVGQAVESSNISDHYKR